MAVRSESHLFECESGARRCSCVYLAHPALLLLSELPEKVSNLRWGVGCTPEPWGRHKTHAQELRTGISKE